MERICVSYSSLKFQPTRLFTLNTLNRLFCIFSLLLFVNTAAFAFEPFIIKDIRLEGLRRISAGTVFNYLPVKIGDQLDQYKANSAIAALFAEGHFKDIRLMRDGDVLVIQMEERPAILKITFTGNKDITTDDLKKALANINFTEGQVFNQSLLEKVELELQRQYFNLGKYAVLVKSTVVPASHNRVAINIDVVEGEVALIHQITIVGNHAFSDDDLLDEIQLSTGGWLSWFTKDNQYAKQKLAADLETLRSFYLDQGYTKFNIDSTQVSITPDKKDVYITINVTEGDQYIVSDTTLEVHRMDDLLMNQAVLEEDLKKKLTVHSGDMFSRKKISESIEAITDRIGDEGYFSPNINPLQNFDEEHKTVSLTFVVDPGKRVYVRRINFAGNTRTRDEVLRREMRQMEGGWLSLSNIKRSRERLDRLSYFDDVSVETPLVPGSSDLVDVNYTVVEKAAGNIVAGVGYSQTYGVQFNASIIQDNFLGTGKRVGVSFSNSEVDRIYSLSYFNPYVTIDGVSRGFTVFSRTTDAEAANLSYYTTDVYGGKLNYGIPISEFNSIGVGFEFDNTHLNTTTYSATEMFDFVNKYGDDYNSYRLTTSWASDTRNRTLLPTAGSLQSISAEVALPFSDLPYYKVNYRHHWLYPIAKDYVLLLKGDVGYGDGYGDTDVLPFFENYTAGGPYSVRGFKENTLGPLDSNERPYGGNLKVVGNVELILPVPFTKNVNSFRISAFLDVGNVYGEDESFETDLLRYSAGLSAIWISPLGPLSFSFAKPLKKMDGDQTQFFQFNIGTTF